MSIQRQFKVAIRDPKTGNVWVHLPVLRTEGQVAALKQHYADVEARAVESTLPEPMPLPDSGDAFRRALVALVACYRDAEKAGDRGLAARAQRACSALIGYQKHLRDDDGNAFNKAEST